MEAAVTVLRITTTVIGVTRSSNIINPRQPIHKHKLAQWQDQVPALLIHMQPVRLCSRPVLTIYLLFLDGGYENYVALWYQATAAQQQQAGQQQGDPTS